MIHKGEKLRELIRKNKAKNIEIAKHIGINSNYLSTLFKDPNLSDEIIEKACEFLGIDMKDHFTNRHDDEVYMEKYILAMEELTKTQAQLIECKNELLMYKKKYGELED